ncbi:hypothetical protein AURDEDRAFT_174208 [Auricularia subglabra TFB-10046 SS5]|nr:hypothetical protein AURDEDRAFT_174208 [Auricularia subglabra TFB-10046 SS5]
MSTTRRRRSTQQRDSSQSPPSEQPLSKRQKNKATREHYERLRARVNSFVQDVVNPGLKDIAIEFDVPVADVRELAHLVVQASTKQRQLSLWQTVVSVESEAAGGNMVEASKRASEKYSRLKDAIRDDDPDNEELAMYEAKRKELEAEREPVKVPSTPVKADRAVIADVTRCGKEIEDKLHALRNSSGIEFCVFMCPGNDRVTFPPHVYRSPKAAEFFKLKTKLDSVLFAQEMAGYTQHGSKVYELLAVQDPKHKTFVSELLTSQLRELTGNPRVKMQWVELKELCAKYNIRLVGWPDDIELLPMSKTTIGKARRLHLLIRDGTLRFERVAADSGAASRPTNAASSAPQPRPSQSGPQAVPASTMPSSALVARPSGQVIQPQTVCSHPHDASTPTTLPLR